MSTEYQDFLSAEQAASDLVAELSGLRDAAEHYSGAAKLLDQTHQSLTELIDRATASAQGLQNVVGALGRIDTPHLLGRMGELDERVSAYQGELKEQLTTLLSELQQATAEMRKQLTAHATDSQGSAKRLSDQLAAEGRALRDALAKVGTKVLYTAVMAGIGVLVAGAVLLHALLTMGR